MSPEVKSEEGGSRRIHAIECGTDRVEIDGADELRT
jgi:hypothetical protein